MSLLGPGAGWTALVPKRDQGRSAIMPWLPKGSKAACPGYQKVAGQSALITKKEQGSLP